MADDQADATSAERQVIGGFELRVLLVIRLVFFEARVFGTQNPIQLRHQGKELLSILLIFYEKTELVNPVAIGFIHGQRKYCNTYHFWYVRCRTKL